MLVSLGILRQTGTDTVHHTAKSLAYVGGSPTQRLFEINFDNVVLSTAHLPEYYRTYGRKECKSDRHTPFSFAMRCPEKDFWEIMNDDPTGKRMSIFMQAMATVEQYFPIAGMYDFSWAVEKGKEDAHKDRAQLVDVGGGKGHCVKVLLEQTEGLVPERCVLQDRPEVIEKSKAAAEGKLAEGVVLQSIDFHKEQPVKGGSQADIRSCFVQLLTLAHAQGAFTYWIRRCLHDYADAVCVNILSIIADAMADDSRLLVVEQILENPPNNFTAWNDLMINCFGGKERTLADFQTLAAGAGLKVSGVFHSKTSPMAVIEMAKSGAA